MPLLGIGTGRARKASGTPPAAATLRKQVHRRTHPDSSTDLIPVAGKSARVGASQRVQSSLSMTWLFWFNLTVGTPSLARFSRCTEPKHSKRSYLFLFLVFHMQLTSWTDSIAPFDYISAVCNCRRDRVSPWSETSYCWIFSA